VPLRGGGPGQLKARAGTAGPGVERAPYPVVSHVCRRRAVAAAWLKLRAAEPGGAGKARAALTTTGRTGTARRPGPGKRDEKAYERNQRLKLSKRHGGRESQPQGGQQAGGERDGMPRPS
jgi:hypothetical protein